MEKFFNYIICFAFVIMHQYSFGQEMRVTGTVTSAEDGDPLPGVNIVIKGTTNGTIADLDGKYSITVSGTDAVLVFSFVGYLQEDIPVNGQTEINITMVEDITALDEIVVIGYGVMNKRDISTSVSHISSDEIVKSKSVSIDKAIQGRIAGVHVSSNGGEPGSGNTVKIRGVSGFAGGDPLYVVDGVVLTSVTNPAEESFVGVSGTNPLNMISPGDIESVSVLKDAAAAAIYGSRGGNGVIIITTKSGSQGKPKINVNSSYGFTRFSNKIETLSAREFAQFSNEARFNMDGDSSNFYSMFLNPDTLTDKTDWLDAITRTGVKKEVQISVSGGSENNKYYISGGYYQEDGILLNSDYERFTLRSNSDNVISKWLKFGNNITLSQVTDHKADLDAIRSALTYNPIFPVKQVIGEKEYYTGISQTGGSYFGLRGNPVRRLELRDNEAKRYRILGNLFLEVEPLKGLVYKPNFGFDYRFNNLHNFNHVYREMPLDTSEIPLKQNSLREASHMEITEQNLSFDNTLTYKKAIAGAHNLELMATYSAQKIEGNYTRLNRNGHINGDLIAVSLGTGTLTGKQEPYQTRTYLSQLARVSYNYRGKYYISANYRRDGSSVFTPKNKYASFLSYSAAWRISDEKFMENLANNNWVKDIKIRASYGESGVDGNLRRAPHYSLVDGNFYYVINGSIEPGFAPEAYLNTSLKWETANMLDIGADISLLKGRLNIVADYFNKTQNDVIYSEQNLSLMGVRDGPYIMRQGNIDINGATISNKGWEISCEYINYEGIIKYQFGANIMSYKNIIKKLPNPIIADGKAAGFVTYTMEGHEVGTFYGYVIEGIFQSQEEIDALQNQSINYDENNNPAYDEDGILEYRVTHYQNEQTAPGDYKFKDLNGDGRITDEDRTLIGSPQPDLIYGFNGTLSYREFDFSFALQGVWGNEIFNYNNYEILATVDGNGNVSKQMLDRWTPDNPNASQPRVHSNDPNNNRRISDRYVEDGSYLRLSQLEVGYNLPSYSALRIYVSLSNVFTLTGYSGFNPDIGTKAKDNIDSSNRGLGIDDRIYPNYRSFMFGINLSL